MTQHFDLDYGEPVHEGFFDAIQEMLGAYVGGLRLERVNGTTLKVAAAADNEQVGIAINGKYRWRTTETTASLPGALPDGEHPVFVTATANVFSGPLGDPDEATDYSFGLTVKKAGETPATTHYREVGKVTVASGSITALRQLVASVSGAQIEDGALSAEGDFDWTRAPSGALIGNLKASSVGANEIADNAVGASEIAPDGVGSSEIAENAVGASEIAPNAVGSSEIQTDAVGADEIVAEGVGTAELAAAGVTNPKLSDGSVSAAKTGAGANGLALGSFSAWVSGTFGSHEKVIVFNEEEWDVSGWFDKTTGLYTPTVAGIYRLSARVRAEVDTGSEENFSIRKNGSYYKSGRPSGAGFASITALVESDGNDTFGIYLKGPLVGGQAVSYFQGELVGRL